MFHLRLVGRPPVPIHPVEQHLWLGLRWQHEQNFLPLLNQRLAAAGAQCASLAGLVANGGVPLAVAMATFEMVIEGSFRFGRWLLAVAPGASEVLNAAYEGWARSFIGAPPWRNAMVAASELGWPLSGAGRAAVDVAVRRATLWALPEDDLYGAVFRGSQAAGHPSWARASLCLLQDWGVEDWPIWKARCAGSLAAYKAYAKTVITGRCLAARAQALDGHPYVQLRPCVSQDLAKGYALGLPTSCLRAQRSVSRLRAGLLTLTHRNRRRSWARLQYCIFCEATLAPEEGLSHALNVCGAWTKGRAAFGQAPGVGAGAEPGASLGAEPGSPGYQQLAEWAGALDSSATEFWSGAP
ncbi:unnamed protein product [Prorocentrum cordatum]|uniref:Uncharacterized protein n=2 Tax=Prorocentrum cordatum TaxID=2364126 RepID=A0ABN9W2B4_9DINO|nr:unnamed protein product [Polarella glacialis]